MGNRWERQRAAPRRKERAGCTLMEVSLAIAVVVIALLAMSASTLRTHSLRRQSRERAVAQNAVRMIAESVQSISGRLDGENWSTAMVAALQEGGELGGRFQVPELTRMGGAPAVGTIVLVTDETTTDQELGVQMGMPRDLNGDGDALDADVTADARVYPVIVTARWRGVSGANTVRHPFYVMRY